MQDQLPLSQLEELRGIAPYYYDWLTHPFDDRWWDWCDLRNKYSRVHAAVLNFSGWYDDNYGPEGATTNFTGLLKARSIASDPESHFAINPETHLLIGPWVHGVGSTARTSSGERTFAPPAAIDYDEVILRWMDHYLRGRANGVETEKPVRYFVMGADQWRDAEAWPPASKEVSYYLISPKAGGNRGRLSAEAPNTQDTFASFISDPAKPVVNAYAVSGAHDYRELANRSGCSDL